MSDEVPYATFVQDQSYEVRQAIAKLHRAIGRWHDSPRAEYGTDAHIALRETAKQLYAFADRIEKETRKEQARNGAPTESENDHG